MSRRSWTGAALIVLNVIARQTRHREGCGTDFEVGVDDEIKVSRRARGFQSVGRLSQLRQR